MEVSLPQTMSQKLLDLLKPESLKFCLKIHVHVICHIRCQVNIDYHNQHESTVLTGLFHTTSSVLPSVESYRNYLKPTQRGVQGYLSSLQWRVDNNIQDLLISSCLNDLTNCYRRFNVDIMMLYISDRDHARKVKFSSYVHLPSINKISQYRYA